MLQATMSDDWRWADPKGEHFRVRLDDLKAALARGDLPRNVRVWKRGWSAWKSAEEVQELGGPVYVTPPPASSSPDGIPPPPQAVMAVQAEFEASAPASMTAPPPGPIYEPTGGDGMRWRKTYSDAEGMGGALRTNDGAPKDSAQMRAENESANAEAERKRAARQPPGPARTIPKSAALAAAGLAILSVLALGFVLGRTSPDSRGGNSNSSGGSANPSSSGGNTSSGNTSSGIVVPTAALTPSGTPTNVPVPDTEGCAVAAERHVVVPYANITAGVEAQMTARGAALGFALSQNDGMGVLLDAPTFSATTTQRARSEERIRRVVAFASERGLSLGLENDRARPKSSPRRSASDLSGELYASENYLYYAHGDDAPLKLFRIEGDGPVEGIRALPMAARTYAFAFKRGGDVFFGELSLTGKNGPTWKLRRVETKRVVAAPSLAVSSRTLAVTWAEHSVDDDVWTISLARLDSDDVGAHASPVVGFPIPRGGLGERALSPSLAGYSGGFALTWTEGPPKNSQVRMQRLTRTLSGKGEPVLVSPPGRNAGEARVALDPESGQGVVAFFVETDAHFGLWGTAAKCARDSAGE